LEDYLLDSIICRKFAIIIGIIVMDNY